MNNKNCRVINTNVIKAAIRRNVKLVENQNDTCSFPFHVSLCTTSPRFRCIDSPLISYYSYIYFIIRYKEKPTHLNLRQRNIPRQFKFLEFPAFQSTFPFSLASSLIVTSCSTFGQKMSKGKSKGGSFAQSITQTRLPDDSLN